MKSKIRAYGILVVIAIIIVYLINANQPTLDSQIVSQCVASGGMFNITTNTCVPSKSASTTKTVKTTSPAPVVTTKPQAVAPARTYPIHMTPTGDATYYSANASSDIVSISNPQAGTVISSPLSVSGLARGSWYFEATAGPVLLTDATGNIIAETHITAQSDWMSKEKVPFLGNLIFPQQKSGTTGVLVIQKDNPSGLAANAASVEIRVVFR